ncbi:MAG: hypothetical protein Kow0098_22760 [Ignavibacteriaceae bacterium]
MTFIISFLFFCLFASGCVLPQNAEEIYIRLAQTGFLSSDIKSAVVISAYKLADRKFDVISVQNKKVVYSDFFPDTSVFYSENFPHCYRIDFSHLKNVGDYKIEINDLADVKFSIVTGKEFSKIVDSLMLFLKVQRCGPTNPLLHGKCHLSDVTSLVGNTELTKADLTGGWHDAGDYIKFFNTTAFTTYLLLFAYEFDQSKFGFDNNDDNVPDILEEARVGIDWIRRCNFEKNNFVLQVQDIRDHSEEWRMPEDDKLRFDRPGFVGIGKNYIGIYSAVLSLAARIWKNEFYDTLFAEECLQSAMEMFQIRNSVPDIDTTTGEYYPDNDYLGKLALAAIELYNSTGKINYLAEAKSYADSAGSDFWWSWGSLNSLAHYKLSLTDTSYLKYITENLQHFNNYSLKNIFNEPLPYNWGTNFYFLGVALQSILYEKIIPDSGLSSLSVLMRDYVAGRNPWGISFIYNIGTKFSEQIHSQIGYLNNGYIPGAVASGPAPYYLIKEKAGNIPAAEEDLFGSDSSVYFDNYYNFITNEATIACNATAIFVYGFFSER